MPLGAVTHELLKAETSRVTALPYFHSKACCVAVLSHFWAFTIPVIPAQTGIHKGWHLHPKHRAWMPIDLGMTISLFD